MVTGCGRPGLVPGSPVAAESGGLAAAGGLDSGRAVLQMGSTECWKSPIAVIY